MVKSFAVPFAVGVDWAVRGFSDNEFHLAVQLPNFRIDDVRHGVVKVVAPHSRGLWEVLGFYYPSLLMLLLYQKPQKPQGKNAFLFILFISA